MDDGNAVLRALFLARRCAVCDSADVMAVCPGADPVLEEMRISTPDGGTLRYTLQRRAATRDISLCLAHWLALLPYKSHREPRRRRGAVIA